MANSRQPIPRPQVPAAAPRPVAGVIPQPQRWTFSFRFWQQIENFGLGDQRINLFLAFINRLHELSKTTLEELQNRDLQDGLRFHEIDWDADNIPLQRNECDWVSEEFLSNEVEYPFMQVMVSKALGRIIGFFDNGVFYIVLLDPLHNLQPARRNNYRVRPTMIGHCSYSRLVNKIERHISQCQCDSKPDLTRQFYAELDEESRGVALMNISNDYLIRMRALIARGVLVSGGEALEEAIRNYEAITE